MRILVVTIAAVLALAAPALADTAVSGPSGTINDRTPAFRFTGEAGATFDCKFEPAGQTVPWRACASPYSQQLADGTYTFWVRATDRAGNVETNPPYRTFTIDTSGIDTAIDAGPSGLTNDPTPSFTFSTATTGATFECSLGGAFEECTPPYTAGKLAAGGYVLRVRAVSPAGRADATPAERAFTVDPDAPDTRITGGPADHGETADARPAFSYDSEPGATYECRLDNRTRDGIDTVEWADCPAGAYTPPALAGGRHTFEVRATDTAGNTDPTPASRTFTVRLCEKVVRFGLIEATGDCLANVGTADAPKWESDGDVQINGLPLPLPGPAKLVLTGPAPDKPGGTLAVTDVTIAPFGVQLYKGGFTWDLPAGGAGDEKELKKIDLTGKDQKLFGLKVEGFAALRLRRPANEGGAYKTVLQLHVALPEIFKSGPNASDGSVTGDVALNWDRDGLHADGVKIAVADAYVAGIGVKSVCMSFVAAGASAVAPCQAPRVGPGPPQPYVQCATNSEQDRWDGALAIVLPTPSRTQIGMWGGLRGGKLANAGASVDNLGTQVPLWPGAWLQSLRLGVCLDPSPLQIKGGFALGFAPLNGASPAIRIDGDFLYRAAYNDQPWLMRVDGRLTLYDKQVASAYLQYLSSGMVDFGFDAALDFDPAHISGGVHGWIETVAPSRFNVQGNVHVCVDQVACADGEAVASSLGLAGCLKVSIVSIPMLVKDADWVWWQPWKMHWENVPVTIEGGFGHTWQTGETRVMVASCSIGDWVLARTAQADAGAVVVAGNQPAVTIRVHGDGAPPKVDLVGPDGRRISVPDRSGGELVKDSHLIASNPADATTTIMVAHPAAGTWRIEPRAGSARVTSVDHADARPQPTIVGGVGGKRYRRTFGYAYAPRPGQKITFVERGPRTARVLGVAGGGSCRHRPRGGDPVRCGVLRFAPARGGAGRRRIVAVIEQDGQPVKPIEVASYTAPPDRLPGRPALLRARRAGGAVVVRWQPSPGASYTAQAALSDGRRLVFTSARGFRIPAVSRGVSVRIAVRRVENGLAGAPARVRVKATRRSPAVPSRARRIR